MVTTKEIFQKQMEISSHQKHFNLILAVATTFLVLISGLHELLLFSIYSEIVIAVIIVIIIIAFLILFLTLWFMIKQKIFHNLFSKIFGLR